MADKTNRYSLMMLIRSIDKYGMLGNYPHLPTDSMVFRERMKSSTDEAEFLQAIIDTSKPVMRMYGSGEEMCENLKIFRTFPGNRKYFEAFENENSFSSLNFEKSLRQNEYINKHDLLAIMEFYLISVPFKEDIYMMTRTMIIFLMRHYERLIDGCHEYVTRETLNAVMTTLAEETKTYSEPIPDLNLIFYSVEELAAQWKGFLDPFWDDVRHDQFHTLFLAFARRYPIRENLELHRKTFVAVFIVYRLVRQIALQVPQICTPFLALDKLTMSKMPIVMRVFEDNSRRFLMFSEVWKGILLYHSFCQDTEKQSINTAYVLQTLQDRLDKKPGFVETMPTKDMSKVLVETGVAMDRIELIVTPIKRAKHSAVPIITTTGHHCKLAVDVLFEVLRNLIVGHRFFQLVKGDWSFLNDAFDYWMLFDSDSPYFIESYKIEEIETRHKESRFNPRGTPVEVRNVKKGGFSLKFLRDELNLLGLVKTLPEILEHAPIAYDTAVKRKKKEVLRTCDLYDALEHCQLLCLFGRLPKLAEFLHSQHGCHRVEGWKCERCAHPEKFKRAEPEPKSEPEPTPTPTPKPAPQPKSKRCEKCTRSAELCSQANQKLKLSQNRVKTLEKRLTTIQTQQQDFDEEKRKMAEESAKQMEFHSAMISEMEQTLAEGFKTSRKALQTMQTHIREQEQREWRLSEWLTRQRLKFADAKASYTRSRVELESELLGERRKVKRMERTIDELKRQILGMQMSLVEPFQIPNEDVKAFQRLLTTPTSGALPDLSSDAVFELEKLLKQQHHEKLGELLDAECLICLLTLDDDTATCHSCQRGFHKECAAEWMFRRNVCPACDADGFIQ